MSTPTTTLLPVGTWKSDPTHSSATFAVKHMVVATFRGSFAEFDATLTVGGDGATELVGTVKADSIVVKDEALKGHLGAPDFFDTARYSDIRYEASDLRREGDELIVDGVLTIKDQSHAVEGRGTITDPHEGFAGQSVGLTLETIIDRTAFGLNWNAPLPKGGFALANDVKLTVELELVLAEG
jgi:polyisoprenoid-binding protein YceI